MISGLRNHFIAGILVVVPTVVAVFIIYRGGAFLDRILDPVLNPVYNALGLPRIPLVGLVLLVFLVWLVGVFASNLLGRRLIQFGENLLVKIPLFNRIYIAMKQILDVFLQDRKAIFLRVVLVEFPQAGCYALGFVTLEPDSSLTEAVAPGLVHVFVPTAPNPTSGFFLMVPPEEALPLDMTVEEGLKMVISGGAVTPRVRPSEDPSRNPLEEKQGGAIAP